ncbi:MAG TPA: septum site-determining protein MinD [Aggregatilineales bacterium]|nr:septum site-determining protein MinD [Aggregatilineales bacterium]
MPARVITITSGKGGVGKTTSTANISAALASMQKKVVCIDADIGLRNLDLILGVENRIVFDLVDVVEGRARPRQALIRHKQYPELYIIPAAQTRDKTAISPQQMTRTVTELRTDFDFIFIDCPAGIERGFRNAIAPADEVLIVTNPEVSAVRDADRIIGMLEADGRKLPARLIINRVKADMVRRGDMLSADDVLDILSIKLIGLIPEDEHILIAANRGLPDPTSKAGRAFRDVARRLTGEEVPLVKMAGGNILKRITGLFSAD